MKPMETAELTMWDRIVDDPFFEDLPFKIETNENDQIILTALILSHSRYQGIITDLLRDHMTGGERPNEFAVQTRKGVKVPDVVWISDERLDSLPKGRKPSPMAPEICVEVLSRSNTKDEIRDKRILYFEEDAEEVWTCDANGRMTFYDSNGKIVASNLAPDFPSQINL